jgi:S1-C subfamily serine protease
MDSSVLVTLFITILLSLCYVLEMSTANVHATNLSTLETLFDRLNQSTVSIVNTIPTNLFNPQIQNLTELGTGYVFDEKGHIITAYHLLSGTTTVDVISSDGNRYGARLLGADPFSDVAILEVDRKTAFSNETTGSNIIHNNNTISNNSLKPVTIGNSTNLRIGDPVVAIGYIFGSSGASMTGGLVSKTDYLLAFPAGGFSIPNMIQSDVTVNPGNSGGPLVDLEGKVVGMIYGRLNPVGVPLGQFPGMTAAIPSNIVNRVASSILEKGYYLHPGIGIIGETLTSNLAQVLVNTTNIPQGLPGVFVSKIEKAGTADLAGIHGSVTNEYGEIIGGDIITAIDGIPVTRFEDLLAYIQEHKSVGDDISFTVYRSGQFLEPRGVVQPFVPSTAR